MEADFSGYATRANVKCADGRVITPQAFAHMDGQTVPLVWQHRHNEPANVLGHAVLEARPDGVFAHGFFNDTQPAQQAKALVEHKDINRLSIYANELVEKGKQVLHGAIREVSLVLSGANPGAVIENVRLAHSDGELEELDDEALIYGADELEHAAPDATVRDIYETLNEDQKRMVHFMIGTALKGTSDMKQSDLPEGDDKQDQTNTLTHQEGSTPMTRNVFENSGVPTQRRATLTHDQLVTIVEDAKKTGSFKESFLAHAVEYGIENIDYLFPDAKLLSNTPELVSRKMEWVSGVMSAVSKSPFSRIKTVSADITLDAARAKGYVKNTLKKEEWFTLSKRETTPQTIYKKQKLDRDDVIDITDLDVVAWLKAEMRLMLEEEVARAILVGDGREVDDPDKIIETKIRPIAFEDDFYAHKITIPANTTGDALVEAILRARPFYRGAGSPTLYLTEDLLTDLLLIKDAMRRRIYPTQAELESALRVSRIVTVPVMEDLTTDGGDLIAIMVNLSDYTIGADRGGAMSMFDDFDIDFNQYKYLLETRMSGALTKFKSAVVFSRSAGTMINATTFAAGVPTFNPSTGVVTITAVTGVVWKQAGVTVTAGAQTAIAAGATVEVTAEPATGYYFKHNTDTDWEFTRNA